MIVVKCEPELKEIQELTTRLNQTRDFYTFLKQIRKAFKEQVKFRSSSSS